MTHLVFHSPGHDQAGRASNPDPSQTFSDFIRYWARGDPDPLPPETKRYDDTLVLVLKTVDYADHDGLRDVWHFVKAGEVMIAVGPGFVITVRDTASTAASLRCANRCISR